MAGERKKRRMMGEINVVPYIDVMLVLLVIFMITAPMLSQGVKVELPQVDSTPIPQDAPEPIMVSVDAAGTYYLSIDGGQNLPLESDELLPRIREALQANPDRQVYIKGDRKVEYGRVVKLLALIQGEIPSVGLITESPDESNEQ